MVDSKSDADVPVIAIDGPGGSGKGTISRAIADRLGWHLLDSGALYRLVGMAALDAGVPLDDAECLAGIARGLSVRFGTGRDDETVYLQGQDVTARVRSEHSGAAASQVAIHQRVRAALIEIQRGFREPPGLVADGRDMGSTIFPDAGLKIFLTASVAERARRRYKQLKDKGIDVSLSALSRDMADRDRRDAQRSAAPLRACPDARILDTTSMGIEEVVSLVASWATEVYGLEAG